MADLLKIVPSINAHITHTKLSKIYEEGIQANIFIEKPPEEGFESVQPKSVYLIACPKGLAPPKFKTLTPDQHFRLSIATYMNLLEFFELTWPNVKLEIEKKFKQLKKKNSAYELHADIHFYHNATAYYEHWLDDLFIYFKKCTTSTDNGQLFLQQGGQSLVLNPDVLHALSKSRSQLADVLFKAGYNEGLSAIVLQSCNDS
jgi:hypothetical protein